LIDETSRKIIKIFIDKRPNYCKKELLMANSMQVDAAA
jgi:hypothetical protein